MLQSAGILSAQSHQKSLMALLWFGLVWLFAAPAKTVGSTGVCQETLSSERDLKKQQQGFGVNTDISGFCFL